MKKRLLAVYQQRSDGDYEFVALVDTDSGMVDSGTLESFRQFWKASLESDYHEHWFDDFKDVLDILEAE